MLDAQLRSLLQRVQAGTAKLEPADVARAILQIDKSLDELNQLLAKAPAGGGTGSGPKWPAIVDPKR